MATPRQTPAGTWRVQIEVRGQRDAATHPTKRAALEWAARRRMELLAAGDGRTGEVKTLQDALDRYGREVSPTKRGEVKELLRLRAFPKQADFPARMRLADLQPSHLAAWRDGRLAVNARGAVLRDMTLVSHVLEVARREWRWIASNPMADVRRPAEPDHRERIIQPLEVRRMLRAMGWLGRAPVRSVAQAVGWCFVLALQTGMRAGELCGLRWQDVRGDFVVLHAGKTKTGKGREVPLSLTARRSIEAMRGWDEALVFGLRAQTLDAMFRKYRGRAGLEGFTFHDARRTAATRISKQLDVMMLCRMFGWRDPKMAMVYYAPHVSSIAAKLHG